MKQLKKGTQIFLLILMAVSLCFAIPTKADAAKVSKVKFSQSSYTISKGSKKTLTVSISPSSEKKRKVNFKSSNSSVISVKRKSNNKVEITAKKTGTATITATVNGTKVKTKCKITVKNPKIATKKVAISPQNVVIYKGHTKTLKASINPSNATYRKVTWSSSNTKIATVNSKGKVTAKKAGTVTITATVKAANKKATCKVTVKNPTVRLTSTSKTVYLGDTYTLKATVTPSSEKVTWSSSNTKVATVNSKGKITAKKEGTATITAKIKGTSMKKTCKITVKKKSLKLSSDKVSIYVGDTKTLRATPTPSGEKILWTSSNTKVATVNSSGKITAKKAGTATITAKIKDTNIKKTCKLTVKNVSAKKVTLSASTVSIRVGDTRTLTATISPSNTTNKSVTWSSSDTSVVTVSTAGKIKGKKAGTATITVKVSGTNIKASCKVTVKNKTATAAEIADKFYHTWKGTSHSTQIENKITKTKMFINGESSGSKYKITNSIVNADGSIWIYATIQDPTQYGLFKISSNGKTMVVTYSHDGGKTYSKTEYTFTKTK